MVFDREIVQNDLFEGIMGQHEFKEYHKLLSTEDRKKLVLISITEPEASAPYMSVDDPTSTIGFHDVLEIKFWDVEYKIGKYEPLTWEQGKIIRDFIVKNKDKKFLIHCRAGVSRSAGVGCAVECLVNHDGDVYNYYLSKSDIKNMPRYDPNLTVFDRIVKAQ
jgi:predicted protein tyrosine phosphatase